MSGELRSSCSPPMGSARTRSCGEPANPRLASGAGKNGSLKKASKACFGTRRGPRVSSRWGAEAGERVVALTLSDPPGETTHWTGALMAKASGLSVSSVQRIWRAHGLQPHRVRQFKVSNDPRFVVTGATDPPRNLSWMSDTPARDQKLNGVLGWLMPWLMPCMMTGLIAGSR